MNKFTEYLIEFSVPQAGVSGGPLSAPIVTGNENRITNSRATPPKLVRYDDPEAQDQSTDDNNEALFVKFLQWLRTQDVDDSSFDDQYSYENEEPMVDDASIDNHDQNGLEFDESDFDMDEEDLDPDKQGMIRVVDDAHLIYKREQPDGFYEELWIYNIGTKTRRDEMEIKRNILASTDIPNNSTESEDGTQKYSIWTCGNAQLIKITGIPN